MPLLYIIVALVILRLLIACVADIVRIAMMLITFTINTIMWVCGTVFNVIYGGGRFIYRAVVARHHPALHTARLSDPRSIAASPYPAHNADWD